LIRKYIGDAPSSKTIQMKDSLTSDATSPETPKNGPKVCMGTKRAKTVINCCVKIQIIGGAICVVLIIFTLFANRWMKSALRNRRT